MGRMRSTPAFGVFLVLGGALLLAERLGRFRFPEGTMWPLLLFLLAITAVFQRKPGTSLMYVLLGLVFLACTTHWHGLSYANAWPLFFVAIGLAVVVSALTREGDQPPPIEGGES